MGVQTCSHRVRPGHSISWDDPRAQLGLLSSPSLAALCCCFPCAPCGDPSSLGDLAQLTKLAVFPLYIHIDTDIFTWLHWLPLWCQLSSTVFLIQVTAHPWHTREGEGRRAWGGEVGGTNGEQPQARAAQPRVHPQSLNLQLAHPEPERGPAAGRDSLGRPARSSPPECQALGALGMCSELLRRDSAHGLIQRAEELGSAHGGLGPHSLAVSAFGS